MKDIFLIGVVAHPGDAAIVFPNYSGKYFFLCYHGGIAIPVTALLLPGEVPWYRACGGCPFDLPFRLPENGSVKKHTRKINPPVTNPLSGAPGFLETTPLNFLRQRPRIGVTRRAAKIPLTDCVLCDSSSRVSVAWSKGDLPRRMPRANGHPSTLQRKSRGCCGDAG